MQKKKRLGRDPINSLSKSAYLSALTSKLDGNEHPRQSPYHLSVCRLQTVGTLEVNLPTFNSHVSSPR